jgi:hypothetical protein
MTPFWSGDYWTRVSRITFSPIRPMAHTADYSIIALLMGELRIIEQPGNIRQFEHAFVVVKLNGGLDHERRIPETYATTRLDY